MYIYTLTAKPIAMILGQHCTCGCGVDADRLAVGELVGVRRSSGSVTLGRVEQSCGINLAGCVRLALGGDSYIENELVEALFSVLC